MAITETIKNLFGKVLTIGTPPEKEVLYKEVIKRKAPKESAEKLFVKDIKKSFKKVFSANEDNIEPSEKAKTPPDKKATKKKVPAKKSATKKPVAKKSSEKKATVKKIPTKKTATTTTKKTTKTKKPVAKKVTEKKTETKKKVTTKKSSTVVKGSKKDAKIALYIKDIKKHYGEVDEAFVAIIVKNLGPSIYRKDAELVSCSDPKELDTVRRNFLVKKLGLDVSKSVLDAAIQDVCEELKGVRTKYRATFYYSLAKKFKKESVLN